MSSKAQQSRDEALHEALHEALSRRERQIMDILYRHREATAAEVRADLSDPPSYSTVRALLSKLEKKGAVQHRTDGPRYVFAPCGARDDARDSALKRLVATFFDGSPAAAANALLDMSGDNLSAEELQSLLEQIEQSRKDG
jgi:predicted transcriptional regulator